VPSISITRTSSFAPISSSVVARRTTLRRHDDLRALADVVVRAGGLRGLVLREHAKCGRGPAAREETHHRREHRGDPRGLHQTEPVEGHAGQSEEREEEHPEPERTEDPEDIRAAVDVETLLDLEILVEPDVRVGVDSVQIGSVHVRAVRIRAVRVVATEQQRGAEEDTSENERGDVDVHEHGARIPRMSRRPASTRDRGDLGVSRSASFGSWMGSCVAFARRPVRWSFPPRATNVRFARTEPRDVARLRGPRRSCRVAGSASRATSQRVVSS